MQMERDLKAWNGMRDEVLMAQFEGRMKEYARAKGAFEAVVRSHNRISSELSVERALTSRLLSQLEEEETRHDAALMEEKRRVRQIEVRVKDDVASAKQRQTEEAMGSGALVITKRDLWGGFANWVAYWDMHVYSHRRYSELLEHVRIASMVTGFQGIRWEAAARGRAKDLRAHGIAVARPFEARIEQMEAESNVLEKSYEEQIRALEVEREAEAEAARAREAALHDEMSALKASLAAHVDASKEFESTIITQSEQIEAMRSALSEQVRASRQVVEALKAELKAVKEEKEEVAPQPEAEEGAQPFVATTTPAEDGAGGAED